MSLDENSKTLIAINTQRGLFCFNGLLFGVASTPDIFQQKMNTMPQGLPGMEAYLDNIIVAMPRDVNGPCLRLLVQRFRKDVVKLRRRKFSFGQLQVTYLGYRISGKGLQAPEYLDGFL